MTLTTIEASIETSPRFLSTFIPDGVGSRLSGEEIRLWIADAKVMTTKTKAARKPEMRSYTLAPDELAALVAYMQTLKK